MDITRHWRLHSARSQLLATRNPTTGEVVLSQQTATIAIDIEPYNFEIEISDGNGHLSGENSMGDGYIAETNTEIIVGKERR